jgi:Zn-dependent protease with chaperone function
MKTTAYRYANEHLILALTLLMVFGVVIFTVTATVCTGGLFFILFLAISFVMGKAHHQELIEHGQRITAQSQPELNEIVQHGLRRIQPGKVETYVIANRALNAYTFGLSSPKIVVLYSSLFKVMDADELLFILGHELGHVALGHTWLNSLVGGMAGIPSPWAAAAILTMAFLWWNRACEYSADRAGLLACGKPEKAVSALVKLAAGPQALTRQGMEKAYRQLDAEDDNLEGNLSEMLMSHPLLIKRIEELRRYATSRDYQRLQAQIARNDQTA